MNLLKPLAAVAPAMLLAFGGCDDISEDNRYIEMPKLDPAARNVLLVDYTGQRCVNCPKAHEDIEALHSLYGDTLIAVAIHGGSPGFEYKTNNTKYIGLADDEGAYYGGKLSDNSRPMFVINQIGEEFTPSDGLWQEKLRETMRKPTDFEIGLTATISADLSTINTSTTVSTTLEADTKVNLQLWVIEDGIVAIQLGEGGKKMEDYVHNHVFRAAVNGLDGEAISVAADNKYEGTHSIERVAGERENWNPDNLSVVAFVYTPADGVQNVVKAKVTAEQ